MGNSRWLLGNVVRLKPLETFTKGPVLRVRALAAWGVMALSIVGSIASVASLFLVPPLSVGTFNRGLLISAAVVFTGLTATTVVDQYRRWTLYQGAVHYLHMLAHRLRNRFDSASIAAFQKRDYIIGDAASGPVDAILYETINDIAALFRSLSGRGSVSVSLLIPTPSIPGREPDRLTTGLWSRPYDPLTRGRRGDESNGRFRSILEIAGSIGGAVYASKDSILIRDVRRSCGELIFDTSPARTRGEETFRYVRSLICVPIVLESKPVFVLAIDCSRPRQFHPDYIELARMGADAFALTCNLLNVGPAIDVRRRLAIGDSVQGGTGHKEV
jgi:hypothetical protein